MIEEKVKLAIADQLGIEASDIKLEDELIADLNADSLDIVQLLMEIEVEYGIEFDDNSDSVKNIKTVQDVVNFISSKN
ncbi:MAG: acyl carrier protein [Bacillota bacterium]